jgi:hypothetical protein
MKIKTYLRRALVVLFTALVVVGLVPTTAQAASGCSGGYSTLFGFANIQCQTGSYAVTTYCKNWLGYVYYAQGPKASAPNMSTVYCTKSGYRPSNVGYVSYS